MDRQLKRLPARSGAILLVIALAMAAGSPAALADYIPEVSATIGEPTPNPVPVGSTATASADFSLSGDTGPIRVQIALDGPLGFATLRVDAAGTSSELTGCAEFGTSVVCNWDGDAVESPQTLSVFIDVADDVLPETGANLHAVVESPTATSEIYASSFMYTAPPLGTTTLSGIVVTEGGIPVNQACVFILASPTYVFPTITGADGTWTLSGLPDDYDFAVGVVPPFVGTFGPCAEAGPPPVPAPGELQPVFYPDIWIDLADPLLTGGLGDPFTFAVDAGATVFSSSASGIESCLTTAAADVDPRPPCVQATTTTTSTPTTTPTSAPPSVDDTIVVDSLPLTGAPVDGFISLSILLLLAGLGVVSTVRARDTSV